MNPIVAEAQSQPTAQPLTVDSSVEVDKPDAIRYVNMTYGINLVHESSMHC